MYRILSADMKSSLYIVLINYYSNDILFSFYVKHIQNDVCL